MNPPVVIGHPGRRPALGGTSPLGRGRPAPRSGSAFAAVLALSIVLPLPRTARASETEGPASETPLETDAPSPSIVWSRENAMAWQNRIGLGLDTPALRLPGSASVGLTASSPGREIRLSSGAKTAIIVTAIVVGVLIIVGVVAIGKPHRHF